MREQLALFDADALHHLQTENWGLRARLEDAKDFFRQQRDALNAAQTTIAQQAARIEALAVHVRGLECQVALWRNLARLEQSAPTSPTPDPLFKRLLVLAHPDKWSQGQGASELAHELTVAINAARAQLEVRP